MNEQALPRFEFEEEFKEKLIELVLYKNMPAEQTSKKYGSPNEDLPFYYKENRKNNCVVLLRFAKTFNKHKI